MNHHILNMIWFHKRALTMLGLSFLIATIIVINIYDAQEKAKKSFSKTYALSYSYQIDSLKTFQPSNLAKRTNNGDIDLTISKFDIKSAKSLTITSPSISSWSPSSSSLSPISSSSSTTNSSTFLSPSSLSSLVSASSSSSSSSSPSLYSSISSASSSSSSSSTSSNVRLQQDVQQSRLISASLPSLAFTDAKKPLNIKQVALNSSESTTITTTTTTPIYRVYPPEYLTLVYNFKINKYNVCDIDHGATYDLIVFVTSAVGNFLEREAIRETWGGYAVERGAMLLFLIGDTLNKTIEEKILEEDEKFSDILQGEYIDSYYNLTLKTMSMMKWVSDNCEKIKFVFKVDDDMFVNMQSIVDFSEMRYFKSAIIGNIARKWAPQRNPGNKWYLPKSIYKELRYPNFATGTSYLITGDAAKPLFETAIKMTPLYLEDVFMTGIVAEKAHIRRLHHSMIRNIHLSITSCNYRFFMTSHRHTPQDIKRLWQLIYEHPCDKKLQKALDKKVKSLSIKNKSTS